MGKGPIRIGIVGLGSWGGTYTRTAIATDGLEIIALCDINLDRANRLIAKEIFGKAAEPKTYRDYKEMISRESLDAVFVSTLADIRPEIAQTAMRAGMHVVVAKPLAKTLIELEDTISIASETDRLLLAGFNFRFRVDAQVTKRFIDKGGLGDPLFARSWTRTVGIPHWGPHYISNQSGGGSVANTAIHAIDLAHWLFGSPELGSAEGVCHSRFPLMPNPPEEWQALLVDYNVEDLSSGYVRYTDGRAMAIESTWLSPPEIAGIGVEIWGSAGFASITPLCLITWQNGLYENRTEEIAPGLAASFVDDNQVRALREMEHFRDCLFGMTSPLVTLEEMRTTQAIMENLYTGSNTVGL